MRGKNEKMIDAITMIAAIEVGLDAAFVVVLAMLAGRLVFGG